MHQWCVYLLGIFFLFLRVVSSFIQKGGETGYEPLYKKMTVLPKKDTDNIKAEIEIDEYSLRNFTRVLQTAREKGVLMVAILIQSTFKMHHT